MNNSQWVAVGIICGILIVNMSLAFLPIKVSHLWIMNCILLLIGSGLYYVLRNENM